MWRYAFENIEKIEPFQGIKCNKPVAKYIDGIFSCNYASIEEASIDMNYDVEHTIIAICENKRNNTREISWKYVMTDIKTKVNEEKGELSSEESENDTVDIALKKPQSGYSLLMKKKKKITTDDTIIETIKPVQRITKTSRPVYQYNLDMKLITRFESAKEAAAIFNTKGSVIVRGCEGLHETVKGFIWKFADEPAS